MHLLFFFFQAVENPTYGEIRDVLTAAGANVIVEVLYFVLLRHLESFKIIHFAYDTVLTLYIACRINFTQENGTAMCSSEEEYGCSSRRRMGVCIWSNFHHVSNTLRE